MTGQDRRDGSRYLLLATAVLVVAIAGYAGYVVYPRFDLPAVAGAGLLVLAAAAAVAPSSRRARFPCSPLCWHDTPVLSSSPPRVCGARLCSPRRCHSGRWPSSSPSARSSLLRRQLAGAVTFTSGTGRAVRVVVGSGLILLGFIQTGRIDANLRGLEPAVHGLLRRQAVLRRRRPVAGAALFGLGYLAAGFG